MAYDPIVITAAVRTPIGGFQGALKSASSTALGAAAIRESLVRAGIHSADVDEVIMGCVLPAGLGQAPARQAAIGGGLPESVPCSTLNKVCSSGMKATMLAADLIVSGSADIVVAGGMESMSNAPYLLDKARSGYRPSHGKIMDHMFLDGLEDTYDKGRAMGTFAEDTAQHYQFSREAQDVYALTSLQRALAAISQGRLTEEIVPVGGTDDDEQPSKARPGEIRLLKPAFRGVAR